MENQADIYIIARDDLAEAPVTLEAEGLRIGRRPSCELVLNHPMVSRIHAGIKKLGGRFYLLNFSKSNPAALNGRLVQFDQAEALVSGDIIRIGPFFLIVERADDTLSIRVMLQMAASVGEAELSSMEQTKLHQSMKFGTTTTAPENIAVALKIFWGKRTREKAGRPSPLHPKRPPTLGKARFNWMPTRDLARPWPFSVFTWAVILVAALSLFAAYRYASAFAPAPVSNPHTRAQFSLTPAIAARPNANSCTTCHALRASMDDKCATCHRAEAFHASNTETHIAAGIGCTSCHAEHKGAEFRPRDAAFLSCAACHNNNNKTVYKNGATVSTPHQGTFGYPREGGVDGKWTWMGLDPEELEIKPEIAQQRYVTDRTGQKQMRGDQDWLNAQFHAIHYRVQARTKETGLPAGQEGTLSCNSCHVGKLSKASMDHDAARQTCAKCHNGMFDAREGRTLIAADKPNCTSCHVQHLYDKYRWGEALLTREASAQRFQGIDQEMQRLNEEESSPNANKRNRKK